MTMEIYIFIACGIIGYTFYAVCMNNKEYMDLKIREIEAKNRLATAKMRPTLSSLARDIDICRGRITDTDVDMEDELGSGRLGLRDLGRNTE